MKYERFGLAFIRIGIWYLESVAYIWLKVVFSALEIILKNKNNKKSQNAAGKVFKKF